MHSIYGQIENILYLFSESKYYIDMTHKEIAMGIIGLVRETLGLISFSKFIQIVFMNEFVDIHNYLTCLNKIRKIFKIKVDNNNNSKHKSYNHNHSDSNTDTNSDSNSDNISENISIINNNGNKVVNNSIKNNH